MHIHKIDTHNRYIPIKACLSSLNVKPASPWGFQFSDGGATDKATGWTTFLGLGKVEFPKKHYENHAEKSVPVL